MYDFKYVKKRKTKIWVTIGAGISSLVVATFVIVSFLGRFVGTFTVKLEAGVIALTLSENHTFENPTTYLRISQLPSFQECEYATLVERVGADELDNDESSYLHGAKYNRDGVTVRALDYFKYTFFVKNVGDVPCTYDLHFNIIDSKSDNGKLVEDTLRFMIYDNNYEENAPVTHNSTVYAKRSLTTHIDEDTGEVSWKEKISTDAYGYAEEFESDRLITTLYEDYFEIDQIKRYTLVMWLEGNDPQSNRNTDAPKNARIKIGVEINAYEI